MLYKMLLALILFSTVALHVLHVHVATWIIEKLNLDVLGIKREEKSYIHVHVPVGHDNISD